MKKNNEALLFKCNSCHTAIRPLTFFDGSVWCPNCKINLFFELSQKAENREHKQTIRDASFLISQELFAKYLCEGEGRDALRCAIDYCRKAAYALDPYALLNLGYYYSLGYVETVHIETGRSFAKLCFELAKRCASAEDADFPKLVDRNLLALSAPFKQSLDSDLFCLNALLTRLKEEERVVAPRLGAFSIRNDDSVDEEERKQLLAQLVELYKLATVYLLKQNIDGKNPFTKITNQNQFAQCFNRDDGVLWFAYLRKGEPIKAYKKQIGEILTDESEVQQNLAIIISEVKKAGNRGADFSDQDVLICSFDEKLYRYYGVDKSKELTAFDRLSRLYRRTQGDR